ncbi:MAG: thioredoxin [Chitinispirillaceae bacterium]|nr:thioredoxin [Chitinispirillaceae bacterium]
MDETLPGSFDELIATADRPVLVDFWAAWCGPCQVMGPIIKQIAAQYAGRIITIKVNTENKQAIALKYRIASIPTLMMFRNGQPVLRIIGLQPIEEIKRQIDAALGTQ